MEIEGLDELNTSIPDTGEEAQETDLEVSDHDDTDQNTDEVGDSVNTHDDELPADYVNAPAGEADDSEEEIAAHKEDTDALSGIEQYLSQFDIEGGMIDFKDGSREHFNKLPADKQVDVLSKLHETSTQEIEDKYGLDESEIGLINYMREQEGTIDEVIDQLARQRVQTYMTAQEVNNMNVMDMSAEEVYTAHLLKSNANATVEQLEEDLATAKKMSNFDNIVNTLKQDMLQEQQNSIASQKQAGINELHTEIESQRKEVVDTISKMDSIDGLAINDGIKNEVLDLILNVDGDGDSQFMTEVFGTPDTLFKAAFWYKNGPDIVSTREEYWKKEKSAAYKRGMADAQNGKKSFSSKDVKDINNTTPHYGESDEIISFDDLYN